MNRVLSVIIASMVPMTLSGCHAKKEAPTEPRLKTFLKQTDSLFERETFDVHTVLGDTPPVEHDGVITTAYVPGAVTVTPIIAVDPAKPGQVQRGASIGMFGMSYVMTASLVPPRRGGGERYHWTMDEDELRDMAQALDFMLSTESKWQQNAPAVDTDIVFQSLDGFGLELGRNEKTDVVTAGQDTHTVQLDMDGVHKLRDATSAAIKVLDDAKL